MKRPLKPLENIPCFRKPWWERDVEMAAFVRSLFGERPVKGIAAECASRFGAERAPSKSGVARFMTALRGGEFRGRMKKRPRPARRTHT
jgi:hypothetical protein